MEDDAEGMAMARADGADSVTHIHPIDSATALHRPVMNRKGDGVPLQQRDDFNPGLHARALLGEDEFPSLKILTRTG